jgi:hypothetical protein
MNSFIQRKNCPFPQVSKPMISLWHRACAWIGANTISRCLCLTWRPSHFEGNAHAHDQWTRQANWTRALLATCATTYLIFFLAEGKSPTPSQTWNGWSWLQYSTFVWKKMVSWLTRSLLCGVMSKCTLRRCGVEISISGGRGMVTVGQTKEEADRGQWTWPSFGCWMNVVVEYCTRKNPIAASGVRLSLERARIFGESSWATNPCVISH